MPRDHGPFKPSTRRSNRTAANRHQPTQPDRLFAVWTVILLLALTMLACGLSPAASGSSVNRVVILNRLATLTPTPGHQSGSVETDAPATDVAGQPAPPTPAAPPATGVPLDDPGAEPVESPAAADGWVFANVQLYPDQAEGLRLLGEMTNNSDVPQTLTEVSGTFYDAQGQVIADAGNTLGYWPVDSVPPGGRIPFELSVEGIQNAANFDLTVMAEPGSVTPRQDFEFGNVNQRTEADSYCLTGQFQNPGAELQDYLVIGATLYDAQNNIINFGDYYQPDLQAMAADQPLEFEICITPPNQGATRYELWAWGE